MKNPIDGGAIGFVRMMIDITYRPIMTQQTDKPTTLEGISDQLTTTLEDISDQLTTIKADMEKSNERFNEYRQATQWVVQLAFGLIASATIITIIGTIFKR
jgi:hypothetical protein